MFLVGDYFQLKGLPEEALDRVQNCLAMVARNFDILCFWNTVNDILAKPTYDHPRIRAAVVEFCTDNLSSLVEGEGEAELRRMVYQMPDFVGDLLAMLAGSKPVEKPTGAYDDIIRKRGKPEKKES